MSTSTVVILALTIFMFLSFLTELQQNKRQSLSTPCRLTFVNLLSHVVAAPLFPSLSVSSSQRWHSVSRGRLCTQPVLSHVQLSHVPLLPHELIIKNMHDNCSRVAV